MIHSDLTTQVLVTGFRALSSAVSHREMLIVVNPSGIVKVLIAFKLKPTQLKRAGLCSLRYITGFKPCICERDNPLFLYGMSG